MDKVCGTCKYHYCENTDKGWVCVNPSSDNCTYYTEYKYTCEEWEQRGEENG